MDSLPQSKSAESGGNPARTASRPPRRFQQERAADTASIYHGNAADIALGQRYSELQQRNAELKRRCNEANHRADAADIRAAAAELRADAWAQIAEARLQDDEQVGGEH